MSIVTQGLGGSPVVSLGYGGYRVAGNFDVFPVEVCITRSAFRDVKIIRNVKDDLFITRLLKGNVSIVRLKSADLTITRLTEADVEIIRKKRKGDLL